MVVMHKCHSILCVGDSNFSMTELQLLSACLCTSNTTTHTITLTPPLSHHHSHTTTLTPSLSHHHSHHHSHTTTLTPSLSSSLHTLTPWMTLTPKGFPLTSGHSLYPAHLPLTDTHTPQPHPHYLSHTLTIVHALIVCCRGIRLANILSLICGRLGPLVEGGDFPWHF